MEDTYGELNQTVRSIANNHKTCILTLAITTLAVVLLSTVPISSTLASTKSFSNSGNIIKSEQNCADTGSCTLTSSNVINQQPASTTPSPSPSPSNPCGPSAQTLLSLSVAESTGFQTLLQGDLQCFGGGGGGFEVPGAIITFTGTGVPPNLVTMTGNPALGRYIVQFPTPTTPGTYTAQAHFAGGNGLDPSESPLEQFQVP